jgi:hypothetical protein
LLQRLSHRDMQIASVLSQPNFSSVHPVVSWLVLRLLSIILKVFAVILSSYCSICNMRAVTI